jgi:hypothetical protein
MDERRDKPAVHMEDKVRAVEAELAKRRRGSKT